MSSLKTKKIIQVVRDLESTYIINYFSDEDK